MEKPLAILKPSLINALAAIFIRNIFYSFIIILVLYGVSILLETFNILDPINKVFWVIIILLLVLIVPLLIQTVILHNTLYYFFRTHVSRELKFFVVKKHSVPYSQIVNITIDISIWDRICKAGDITLHTAEDKTPDLVLHYIKEPEKIEKHIYAMMHRIKKPAV